LKLNLKNLKEIVGMELKKSDKGEKTVKAKRVNGYSLKKRKLKDWIYNHGKTQPYMAKRLGITKARLQKKLNEHGLFDETQIRSLVYLVGAETAIDIIFFPTIKEKRMVWRKTFGQEPIKGGIN